MFQIKNRINKRIHTDGQHHSFIRRIRRRRGSRCHRQSRLTAYGPRDPGLPRFAPAISTSTTLASLRQKQAALSDSRRHIGLDVNPPDSLTFLSRRRTRWCFCCRCMLSAGYAGSRNLYVIRGITASRAKCQGPFAFFQTTQQPKRICRRVSYVW